MTAIRLVAIGNVGHMHWRAFEDMTAIRLSADGRTMKATALSAPESEDATTTVRLVGAAWDGANDQISTGIAGAVSAAGARLPALLVSYFYWPGFERYRARYAFRDYALDSGAFSAYTTGAKIDLGAYIDFCLKALEEDRQCAEVFALDVIGDWRASQRNTERMWAAGVPAIPVYHYREPESLLREYAAASPKIALGGISDLRGKAQTEFAEQVFARVYPHRIHGLAVAGEAMLMRLPFHSVDATNWILGPAGFGSYKSMGKPERAPRGKQVNLRAEVQWWLALERRVGQRWAQEMRRLESDLPPWPIKRRAAPPDPSPQARTA